MVVFRLQGTEDTLATPELVEIEYPDIPIQDLADSLGVNREEPARIEWWVWALDDASWVLAENAIFWFEIPALGVEGEGLPPVPETHYLSPAFPNPFNSFTTVRFGLPTSGPVEISVWDMHGRKVDVIASGEMRPGRYEAVWNAEGQTSGIYLIRFQTTNFSSMRKAILIR